MRIPKELYTIEDQATFVDQLQALLAKGEYITVITNIFNAVNIVYYEGRVESVTVNGVPVDKSQPQKQMQMFATMINGIKESAIDAMIEKQLKSLTDYMLNHPEAAESLFISEQLSLLRKAESLTKVLDVLTGISARIVIKKIGWYKKYSGEFIDNVNKIHQVANASRLNKVHEQVGSLVEQLENSLDYLRIYDYKPNKNGEIHTYAFDLWEGNENRPGDRYANAIRNPGSSLKDILRNVKIGSKSIADIVAEMVDEKPELRDLILHDLTLKKTPFSSIDEFIKMTPNYLAEIKEYARVYARDLKLQGLDPIMDRLLFIKILQTLDEGLGINEGGKDLYTAFEGLYEQCTKPDQTQKKEVTEQFQKIIDQAKLLLIYHDRNYRDIVKLPDGMHYTQPLIIYDNNKKKIFDKRDNQAIIKYLNEYLDSFETRKDFDENLMIRAIMIRDYLNKPNQYITSNPKIFENFVDWVSQAEKMDNAKYDMPNEALKNKVDECGLLLREQVKELQKMGVDTSDLEKALAELLQQRKQMSEAYPKEMAVKSEILSIGQTAFVNYFENELTSSFRMDGNTVALAGGGKAKISFNFDGSGSAFINVSNVQNQFLVGDDPKKGPTPTRIRQNGQPYDYSADENSKVVPLNDALTTRFAIHLSADENNKGYVKAKLTELRFISGVENLENVNVKGTEAKRREENLPHPSNR